jgi:homocysteine S-methyltransferase
LNHGTDLAGKPIGEPTKLFIGVGANPGAIDFDEEMRRFELKVKGGAEYVLTQPVYDIDLFEKFHKTASPYGIPILIGILPLYSYRNAEFLHNEVPGMTIPEKIRDRMEKVGSGPKAQEERIAIARESLRSCRDMAQGVYIMPPFNKVSLALEILK